MPDGLSQPAALARLRATGDAIVEGVERCVPGWAVGGVERVLAAWGQLDAAAHATAVDEARAAGRAAAQRVSDELRTLLARDPAEQAATPLEIVRGAVREPTEVLARAGVPPVVRDEFEERALPEDLYGLAPRTLGDLGDESLAPLHLAWGMAKVAVLRARADT